MIVECRRLFDGHAIHEGARVLTQGERIVAVQTGLAARAPAPAPEAAGGGAGEPPLRCEFAMPGLIDSHVHAFGQAEGWPGGRPYDLHEHFLRLALYAGVTTLRDTGNSLEAVGYLRAWSERTAGPRIVASGPVLDGPPFFWAFSRRAETPEQAEREVDRLACEGVDFIKAYSNVAPRALEAAVRAAQRHGLGVAAYPGATTALAASEAGVRSLEHLAHFLDPAWLPPFDRAEYRGMAGRLRLWSRVALDAAPLQGLIDSLAARDVAVCPTMLLNRRLAFVDEMINEPYLDYMVAVMPYHRHLLRMRDPFGYAIGKRLMARRVDLPKLDKEGKAEAHRGLDRLGELLVRLGQRGVRLLAGSDSPNPSMVPGFGLHREMAEWAAAGVPAAQVLAAATSVPARHLGCDDLGVVAAGARADLLLLREDPTTDLRVLSSEKNEIVCRGRRVDRAALKAALVEAAEAQ